MVYLPTFASKVLIELQDQIRNFRINIDLTRRIFNLQTLRMQTNALTAQKHPLCPFNIKVPQIQNHNPSAEASKGH